MAINYEKVGWDTTKFVGPTNMNQMDDGIKAACDGVDALNTAMGSADISGVGDGTVKGAIKEVNNNLEYKSVNFPSNYHGLSSCSAKRFGKNVQIIIGGILDKDFIAGTGYAVMYISALRSAVGYVGNLLSGIEYNSNAICRLHYDDEFLYFESDKNISLGSSVYAFFNYIE